MVRCINHSLLAAINPDCQLAIGIACNWEGGAGYPPKKKKKHHPPRPNSIGNFLHVAATYVPRHFAWQNNLHGSLIQLQLDWRAALGTVVATSTITVQQQQQLPPSC